MSLVCAGAFGELGADPSLPTTAVPNGDTQLIVTGDTQDPRVLTRELDQGSAPRVIDASAENPVSAAELQTVRTASVQGLTATSCVEPSHEQWLVGGGTALGLSSTVVLGNPFDVPATVQLSIFDTAGPVTSTTSAGVLVPAGAQRIVSVNGYAPGRDQLVLRVDSTGAAVTAALGVSQTVDIRSFSVDSVTRQLAPATSLVVPGISNAQPSEAGIDGDADDFPVVVRLLAPGNVSGKAEVRGLLASGEAVSLGTVDVVGDRVAELKVAKWDARIQAIAVDADVPVVAGVLGSADAPPAHDNGWFSPAPALPVDTEVAVSVVPGGELVLANTGTQDANITLRSDDGLNKETKVKLAAGTATKVDSREQLWLSTDVPISAGVRVVKGANIAGYPVLPPQPRSTLLTVYPR